MVIKFEGLDELIKEAERIASEPEINKTNKKILTRSAEVVKSKLKPKVKKSKNPEHSGIKGKKTGTHAADNIEVSKIQGVKESKFIKVGWDYDKPHGYMQWQEWGNTTREPQPVLYPTIEASKTELDRIAVEEYKKLVEKLK